MWDLKGYQFYWEPVVKIIFKNQMCDTIIDELFFFLNNTLNNTIYSQV